MLLLLACISPNHQSVNSDVLWSSPDRPQPILDTGVPQPPDTTPDDSGSEEIPSPPALLLNEVMTNNSSYAGEGGQLSDWVEIYNASPDTIAMNRVTLTDGSGLIWLGSSTESIEAGGHYVIYADSGQSVGGAPFSLSASGDTLTLAVDGQVTDRLATGTLGEDLVWGRYPDGGEWAPSSWVSLGEKNADEPSDTLDVSAFQQDRMYEVNVVLDAAAYASLQRSGTTWVEGGLTVDNYEVAPVGVRLRGAYTYLPLGQKSGFKIDFNRYADLRYRGLQKINLLNMMAYSSGVKDYSIYEIARHVGVPSIRNSYANVSVNDTPYGVYLFSETYDDVFMKNWYGDDTGAMVWEPNSGDINGSFGYWDCEVGPCDTSVVSRVSAILNSSPTDDNLALLDQYMDVDSVLMMIAIESYVGDWDGYCASHNYRVIYDAQSDRIALTLSSMDLTIDRPDPYVTACRGSVYTWCQRNSTCQQRYNDTLLRLADGIEDYDMVSRLAEVRDMIGPDMVTQGVRPISQATFDAEYDMVTSYWTALPDFLRDQAN